MNPIPLGRETRGISPFSSFVLRPLLPFWGASSPFTRDAGSRRKFGQNNAGRVTFARFENILRLNCPRCAPPPKKKVEFVAHDSYREPGQVAASTCCGKGSKRSGSRGRPFRTRPFLLLLHFCPSGRRQIFPRRKEEKRRRRRRCLLREPSCSL